MLSFRFFRFNKRALNVVTLVLFFVFVADINLVFSQADVVGGALAWGLGWLSSILVYLVSTIFTVVANILLFIINTALSIILWLAGYLLNVVIYLTVVQFRFNFVDLNLAGVGGFFLGAPGEDLIYYFWGIIRDFVNILLLLTIIYHAVRTMFVGWEDTWKKFLFLLLFSIVVNFSLFFVKVAIDISNILTLQAYTLMANPSGFDSWASFTTRQSDNSTDPSTISEYLAKIANLGSFKESSLGQKVASLGLGTFNQAAFIYRVGMAIIYFGLIYLTVFLISFLIMRAIAFLWAMFLAPLLALDIFFGLIEQNLNDENKPTEYQFVASIRPFTTHAKEGFFEALVRAPVLFFFLFVVGTLSDVIFSKSVASEIAGNFNTNPRAYQAMGFTDGGVLEDMLAIFLKFSIFFALTYAMFDKLSAIRLGKGVSWVGNAGTRMANFMFRNTVGRGVLGGTAWAGRELVSRRFMNSKLVQNLNDRLNELTKSKTLTGKLIGNRLGELGLRVMNRVKESSMDIRASKRVQKFAEAVTKATGDKEGKGGIRLDFGKPAEGGYKVLDEKAVEETEKRLKAYIDTAKAGVQVSEDEIKREITDKGKDKVEFAGGRFNAGEIQQIIQEMAKEGDNLPDKFKVGGQSLNRADLKPLVNDKDPKTGLTAAEVAIINSKKKFEDEKKALIAKKAGEVEAAIKKNVAAREGPIFITEKMFDARTGQKVAEKIQREFAESVKTDKRKIAEKISVIRQFRADMISTRDQIQLILESRIDLDEKKRASLEGLLNTLNDDLRKVPTDAEIISKPEEINAFGEKADLHFRVLNAQSKAREILMGIYDRESSELKNLKAAREAASREYEAYVKTKPEDAFIGRSFTSEELRNERLRLIDETHKAKKRLDELSKAENEGYNNAQRIEEKIKSLNEMLERHFVPKVESATPESAAKGATDSSATPKK